MAMRSLWGWVVVVMAALSIPRAGVASTADSPRISARAAVLMDGGTGQVIWAREPDLELPPASTTKVMTAVLALESGSLGQAFPASTEACRVVPSKVSLRPGQRLNLENLVYAILLNSANDASLVIAEGLAGSVTAFAERMTARARQLGALNTRFMNPHGLTAEGHYSTARDLATIFRHALDVPKFRGIISTKAISVGVENSRRTISLRSHNRLLDSYRIPVVGKTGYTIPAKKCFVGAGNHDGREIIVAVARLHRSLGRHAPAVGVRIRREHAARAAAAARTTHTVEAGSERSSYRALGVEHGPVRGPGRHLRSHRPRAEIAARARETRPRRGDQSGRQRSRQEPAYALPGPGRDLS